MAVEDIYPVTLIMDRYTGAYSGAVWTAWNENKENVPDEIDGDDGAASEFWASAATSHIIGLGNTPNDALRSLQDKLIGLPSYYERKLAKAGFKL